MISKISAIKESHDHEYIMILQELRRLGIAPTGIKHVDKARLEQAKAEKAQKVLENKIESSPQKADEEREKLEQLRTGAMALAQINRILLGI